jgi:hypothetical protein
LHTTSGRLALHTDSCAAVVAVELNSHEAIGDATATRQRHEAHVSKYNGSAFSSYSNLSESHGQSALHASSA